MFDTFKAKPVYFCIENNFSCWTF